MRLVLVASIICTVLITGGVCKNSTESRWRNRLEPPTGWMDVVKAYMNAMANRLANLGGSGSRVSNTTDAVSTSDKTLMTSAVNRVDAFERMMGRAKNNVNSGLDTARERTGSWVNRALNWMTGK